MSAGVLSSTERRNVLAFWFGSALVSAGVVLHLPMFWMARNTGYVLSGMPMDAGMLWGMALIVGGIVCAGYGLLPNRVTVTGSPASVACCPTNMNVSSSAFAFAT